MRYGNCYVYCARQWWRHGGYVVVRRSEWGWWLHMSWTPDRITFYEFVPLGPKRVRAWWDVPIWFRGRIIAHQPARKL